MVYFLIGLVILGMLFGVGKDDPYADTRPLKQRLKTALIVIPIMVIIWLIVVALISYLKPL